MAQIVSPAEAIAEAVRNGGTVLEPRPETVELGPTGIFPQGSVPDVRAGTGRDVRVCSGPAEIAPPIQPGLAALSRLLPAPVG